MEHREDGRIDRVDLFRAGPLIMFDEEGPTLGNLVESPLLHDIDAQSAVPIIRIPG